jgi:adenine phosphoribosyltransferase
MTADGQKCRLKNEPKSDRKKTKPARLKSPRAHRKNRPHNCGEKTKRRDDEKLSIHQNGTLKSRSLLGNQAFAYALARKSIRLSHEHQTSYARNRRRLKGKYGNTLTFRRAPVASGCMPDMLEKLRAGIRDVPDFPKKGIIFKDITPILSDRVLFRTSIDLFVERCRGKKIDKIVGIDARGFLFGSTVAYELGVGFVPIRKRGKLPYKTEIAKYSLEYGEAEMEMHIDAMMRGERVVLVDDLLATGGTSAAAAALIAKVGGELLEAQFLIELGFLNGRKQLDPTPVISFLKY